MTPQAALTDLLARVGAANSADVLVNDHELSQWPGVAVAAMKARKLLAKARPASSTVCPGFDRPCVIPVHTSLTQTRKPESLIVCDKRRDLNRVAVPVSLLTQLQASGDLIGDLLADFLYVFLH